MPAPYYPYNVPNPQYQYPQTTSPQQYSAFNQPPSAYSAQTAMPSMMPGRMINTVEEITAQEVPMNGDISIFPQRDGNAIYVKSWNSDGTIRTMKFVPDMSDHSKDRSNDDISSRLDDIEKRLGRLEYRKKQYTNDKPRNNRGNYSTSRDNRDDVEEAEVIDND